MKNDEVRIIREQRRDILVAALTKKSQTQQGDCAPKVGSSYDYLCWCSCGIVGRVT